MRTRPSFQNVETNAEKIGKRGHRFNFERFTPYGFMLPAAVFLGVVLGNPALGVALTHSPNFTSFSLVLPFAIGLGLAILFNKAFLLHHRGPLLFASCIFFRCIRHR